MNILSAVKFAWYFTSAIRSHYQRLLSFCPDSEEELHT